MRGLLAALPALLAVAVSAAPPPPAAPGPGDADRGPPQRWARPFISPMGEPFREGPDPAAAWFAGVDRDHDGKLTRAEFRADAMRFFATLDVNYDHEIGPEEIDRYEQVVAPETGSGRFEPDAPGGGQKKGGHQGGRHGGGGMGGRGGGGGGGGRDHSRGGDEEADSDGSAPASRNIGDGTARQGAARYGYLAMPEPVIAADADFNRGISEVEFAQAADRRFSMLDTNGDGVITADELPKLGGGGGGGRRGRPGGGRPSPRD